MSKTVLKNTLRYFEALLEEMRSEWRAGTKVQQQEIVTKALVITMLRDDVQARLDKLAG